MNRRIINMALILLLLAIAPTRAPGANPAGDSEARQLREILLSETLPDTAAVNRRDALHPTEHPETASDARWWQSGFLKSDGSWQRVEAIDDTNLQLQKQYRSHRSGAPKTFDGQMKLANWCRDQHLTDQELAHLFQAIAFSDPSADTTAIYKRMGFKHIGQQWLSPMEFTALQDSIRRDDENLKQWRPAVERIARNWTGNSRQRKQAAEDLGTIHSADAVPALIRATAGSESLAIAICSQLDSIPSFEAAQGLAWIAIHSESSSVRLAAAKFLKEKRIDDVAPALLREMRGLFTVGNPSGKSDGPKLIFREEAERYLAVEVHSIFEVAGTAIYSRRLGRFIGPIRVSERALQDQARAFEDIQYGLQRQIDEENEHAEEYNKRAALVLAEMTGQECCTDPRYWWAWWLIHTGCEPIPKKVSVLHKGVRCPPQIRVVYCSCLAGSTPICTDRGLVAIESIKVGDRVLSKNIETGEVRYKPVLHTTVRQPVPVATFVVDGTSITASEGHHFWSSGTGWTKTRDLKSGSPMHCATGMSRIDTVTQESASAPVYNLVVADFHTYFVGEKRILSHDVLQPSPTDVKVPGLGIE